MIKSVILLLFAFVTLATNAEAAAQRKKYNTSNNNNPQSASRVSQGTLISINIIDRNGLSETVCSKDKLKKYQNIDFLSSQPYQKVLRIYKDRQGKTKSFLTAYHPNGQIRQYLEASNNRAFGEYKEWFSNGQLKIQAHVIGGVADLNPAAESGWLFEGTTTAFNEDGNKIAEIPYSKGYLEGIARYYHSNGNIWKECPYHQNLLHGTLTVYLSNGDILQTNQFSNGKKSGLCIRYHTPNNIASEEHYTEDILNEGKFYEMNGLLISEIVKGQGTKINFGKNGIASKEEYHSGKPTGSVTIFEEETGHIKRTYYLKNNVKTGEEIFYYPEGKQPRLLITRANGIIQGPIKTWYDNGTLESCRQMSLNKKNGLLTAYYPGGQIMLVEEYENDFLIKGEYYKPGEKQSCSKVEKGNGTATLFTKNGAVYQKIIYQDGRPLLG